MTQHTNTIVQSQLADCRLCADRFAKTKLQHTPQPVVWYAPGAPIIIAGQAPGKRVHESRRPFTDPSGDRLRTWLAVSEAEFYDKSRFAIIPMGFCIPGYNEHGHDLLPPKLCAQTWRQRVLDDIGPPQLTIVVGAAAANWHLQMRQSLTETVRDWRRYAPSTFVLPHPSWRNTGWLKKNPWFEAELLPELRLHLRTILNDQQSR